MPHDSKNRLIEVGDVVMVKPCNQPRTYVGTVQTMNESETCSGEIRFQTVGGLKEDWFNACDAELVLKANGDKLITEE